MSHKSNTNICNPESITSPLLNNCNVPKVIELYEIITPISGSYDSYGETVMATFINTNNATVADGSGSWANTLGTQNSTIGAPDGQIQDANQYTGTSLQTLIRTTPFTPPAGVTIQNFRAYFYARANTNTATANDGVFMYSVIENPNSLNLSNVLPNGTTQPTGNFFSDIPNYNSLAFSQPVFGVNMIDPTHTDASNITTVNLIDNFRRTGGWRNIHTLPIGTYTYMCTVPNVTYANVANGLAILTNVDDDSAVGSTPSIGLDSVRLTYDYVRLASTKKFVRTICPDGSFIDRNLDGTLYVQSPGSIVMTNEEYLVSEFCTCITDASVETTYTTTIGSEYLNTAFTVPSGGLNLKGVSIQNYTSAVLQFGTNKGPHTVGPGGSIEFNVFPYESSITFGSITVLTGTFNPGEYVILNYIRQV